MRMLRGTIIILLLIGLPALAVHGDASRLLFGDAGLDTAAVSQEILPEQSRPEALVAVAADSPASLQVAKTADVDAKVSAVYPTFKPDVRSPAEEMAKVPARSLASPSGAKRLRPAIYRPLASEESPVIERTPANLGGDLEPVPHAPPRNQQEIEHRLRSLGARQYRLTRQEGGFQFLCEFPPSETADTPKVFQAHARDGLDAMHDVLAQVQDWDHGRIR